jgi:hypothetical protein
MHGAVDVDMTEDVVHPAPNVVAILADVNQGLSTLTAATNIARSRHPYPFADASTLLTDPFFTTLLRDPEYSVFLMATSSLVLPLILIALAMPISRLSLLLRARITGFLPHATCLHHPLETAALVHPCPTTISPTLYNPTRLYTRLALLLPRRLCPRRLRRLCIHARLAPLLPPRLCLLIPALHYLISVLPLRHGILSLLLMSLLRL